MDVSKEIQSLLGANAEESLSIVRKLREVHCCFRCCLRFLSCRPLKLYAVPEQAGALHYKRDRPTLHLLMHSRISVLHLQSCSTVKIKRLISYAQRVLVVSLLLTIQSFRMIYNNVSNAKATRPNK